MMKKEFRYSSILLLFIFLAAGCGSTKKVAYLQGAGEADIDLYMFPGAPLYDARIMAKDLLTISVTASDPEAVQAFNLSVPRSVSPSNLSTTSQLQMLPYLVDNNGQINFPEIGMITLSGLTKREAEQKLSGLLTRYLKEPPLVTVNFVNYKISVIGEVARPNTFTISNEKVNIFEALAMAGDMTIWGRRDNVKIIREEADGKKQVILMDLNDRNIITSPHFFLQQNDVVYVEPNKTRAQSSEIGSATSLWFTGTSILISVASLLINILK